MRFTPDTLTTRVVQDLMDSASPVTGNIEYACSIWLDHAWFRQAEQAPKVLEAAEVICRALNRRHNAAS